MSIKSDTCIRQLGKSLVNPFNDRQVRSKVIINKQKGEFITEKVISYGTSSYGYDIRCDRMFDVFCGDSKDIVDPKNMDDLLYESIVDDYCIIPPNSYALATSIEWIQVPRNVLAICQGKSTYARCGIIVNTTPLEPEWEGFLTICIVNSSPSSVKITGGEGIAQVLFFESDYACEESYKDRRGKYQNQIGIIKSKL